MTTSLSMYAWLYVSPMTFAGRSLTRVAKNELPRSVPTSELGGAQQAEGGKHSEIWWTIGSRLVEGSTILEQEFLAHGQF